MRDIRLVPAGGLIGWPCGRSQTRWAKSVPGMRRGGVMGRVGWGRDLGFGGSLWFRRFKASHFEIGHQLVGDFSEDRLSQSLHGGLQGATERENSDTRLFLTEWRKHFWHFDKAPLRLAAVDVTSSNLAQWEPPWGGRSYKTLSRFWRRLLSKMVVIYFSLWSRLLLRPNITRGFHWEWTGHVTPAR